MRLYFDTNVYSYIAAACEEKEVRRLLTGAGYGIRASASNLFEIYAIPDNDRRIREVNALTTVATSFEQRPQSWLQAEEVRREIKRLRPSWIKPRVRVQTIRQFLRAHRQMWQDACSKILPPSKDYAQYHYQFEGGIRSQRRFQKDMRKLRLDAASEARVTISSHEFEKEFGLDPEVFWRNECAHVWYEALVTRNPASRDYADWLDPFLRDSVFKDSSYQRFWCEDVTAETVPRNRLSGLMDYYQTSYKIGHGNAEDTIHAGHLFDEDVFVTSDVAFHKVLSQIVQLHLDGVGEPLLLERSAPSALEQLRTAFSL